jgi:hypothetical protein
MKPLVIYTALFGDYDKLRQHRFICDEADYVCFTDQDIAAPGNWKIIKTTAPADRDNALKNRFYKWNPHQFFADYETSLYLDASLEIIDDLVFERVKQLGKAGSLISAARHYACDCVYDEARRVLHYGKDTESHVNAWIAKLQGENYPKHNGMWECTLLFRRHNDPQVIAMNEAVWHILSASGGVQRDQLCFPWVTHQQGLSVVDWNLDFHVETSFERFYGCFLYPHSSEHDVYMHYFSNELRRMNKILDSKKLLLRRWCALVVKDCLQWMPFFRKR